jgi:hypothetical protein
MFTGLEIGFFCVLLGLLTGAGMSYGYQDANFASGAAAALIAALGILGTKVMIFVYVIYAFVTGAGDIELQRTYVVARMTERELDELGIYDEAQRDVAMDSTLNRIKREVDEMTDEEVAAKWKELQDREADDEAAAKERQQRARLVGHHVQRRTANTTSLDLDERERRKIFEEERERCAKLSRAELEKAITELDAWEAGGKWADAEYVREHLIGLLVAQKIEELDKAAAAAHGGRYSGGEQATRSFRVAAAQQADAMTPEQRLAEVQRIEKANQTEVDRARLSAHRADMLALERGLARGDPQRSSLYDQERKACESMSPDEVDQAAKELDTWEKGGKWSDARYLRNHLILTYAERAVQEQRDDYLKRGATHWDPTPEDWKQYYANATAEVDAIPADQHADTARELEFQEEEQFRQRWKEEEKEEAKEAARSAVSLFFSTMFNPFAAGFYLISIGVAYFMAVKDY